MARPACSGLRIASSKPLGYAPDFDYEPVSRDEIVRREKIEVDNQALDETGREAMQTASQKLIELTADLQMSQEQNRLAALYRVSNAYRNGRLRRFPRHAP